MSEIIFNVPDFPGYYVTKEGKVLREVRPRNHSAGYLLICLTKDKKAHDLYHHRLIAQVFLPNPQNKPQVNHKDFNRKNNNINNLEWVTKRENRIHASSVPRKPYKKRTKVE